MAEEEIPKTGVEPEPAAPSEVERPEGRTTTLSVRVTPSESERVRKLVAFAYELGIIPEKTQQALLLRGLNHVYNEVRQAYHELRDGRR